MRLIDADAFDTILENGEIEAKKQRKYVLASALNTVRGNLAKQSSVSSNCSEFPNSWIPCSELPEYDFYAVLIRWHDKRKGCEDEYILCEGYVVREHWCCIFEDADMSDYEPVEWTPINQRRMNHDLL